MEAKSQLVLNNVSFAENYRNTISSNKSNSASVFDLHAGFSQILVAK